MRILMLGSGPNVIACRDWPREPFDKIVAINNAWKVRSDWDYAVYPEDFPVDRRPVTLSPHQSRIEADKFVPMANRYGGIVWCGATMAFTAAYWALGALSPSAIAFLGCDMVYGQGQTHFYGTGAPDPLRADITLRSLEAKAARLYLLAAEEDCALVNLSNEPSRLVFPRASRHEIPSLRPRNVPLKAVEELRADEDALGYHAPSGRYWEEEASFDTVEIDRIDARWLETLAN